MCKVLMMVLIGILSHGVTSGMLSSLPARHVHQDNREAVGGAVVSVVTQGLGECRLLLVTASPTTDVLVHALGWVLIYRSSVLVPFVTWTTHLSISNGLQSVPSLGWITTRHPPLYTHLRLNGNTPQHL